MIRSGAGTLSAWLDPSGCPTERPPPPEGPTRELHDAVDAHAARDGVGWLHPTDETLTLDLGSSARVVAWQERKAASVLVGETCWSDLPPIYGRYGTQASQALAARIAELYGARAALVTDCGMASVALAFDVLFQPGAHAVLCRQVYNKSRLYLERLVRLLGGSLTLVDDGDLPALAGAIRPQTRIVFCETFTNPLVRAQDPVALSSLLVQAREHAPDVRLVVDDTVATPWGPKQPLLSHPGIDVVVGSGTKSLGGQDRDLCGYFATNRIDLANAAMDLLAMRGGILDARRARIVLDGLETAGDRHAQRCATAAEVAAFLASHPRVALVWHPSVAQHPDHEVANRHYVRLGSLLSFRVAGDEEAHRRLADELARFRVFRYALSFDGLVTKVNHHRTVSEYFTPEPLLRRLGFDRLVRIGVGLESSEDLIAALNWTLWHGVA